MPWDKITKRISDDSYVGGHIDLGIDTKLCRSIPETTARELWEIKQEHDANQQRVDVYYTENNQLKKRLELANKVIEKALSMICAECSGRQEGKWHDLTNELRSVYK